MSVTFVNYGMFNSNSGGHVAHFANELADMGEDVFVLGANDPDSALDFGPRRFRAFTFAQIERQLPADLTRAMRAPGSVIHAWTPREHVRETTSRIVQECGCPYVVHLEDNEEVVTSSQLGRSWKSLAAARVSELDALVPSHLTHPVRGPAFIGGAAGATVIVEALGAFVPTGRPTLLLEPGVNAQLFAPNDDAAERSRLRRDLFIPDSAFLLVYHGNMHTANEREVFSLYTAVMILQRRGLDVRLIRTGTDYTDGLDLSYAHLRQWVINLGHMDRDELVRTLKLADAYVQPGSIDQFNEYRLPSKVPEFLALGRPTILPKTNIGLKLSDDEAIRLPRGYGVDIADQLQVLIADPERRRRLGEGARAFALANLNWTHNAEKLGQFYRRVASSVPAGQAAGVARG